MIALFFLLTVTIRPAAPSVGDPITLEYQVPAGTRVALDSSPHFEVVRMNGAQVVVRTFEPHPFTVSARASGKTLGTITVPVKSVLKPNDTMQPAPLEPPREVPMPRRPFVIIGVAALLTAAAWAAVVWMARRKRATAFEEILTPADRFRRTVDALVADSRAPLRWASLADATRAYLAAAIPDLSPARTSSQLLGGLTSRLAAGEPAGRLPAVLGEDVDAGPPAASRLDRRQLAGTLPIVAEILEQGDLEKFSPWGPAPRDFSTLAQRALTLSDILEPRDEEERAA